MWSVFDKVYQSNSILNALDKLVEIMNSVKMSVGFSCVAIKTMGRPLSVMAHLKNCIVEFKTEHNCLADALIIVISKADNDSNYKSHRKSCNIRHVDQNLPKTTGINLANSAGSRNSPDSRNIFTNIRSITDQGLSCDNII